MPSEIGVPNNSASGAAVRFLERNCPTSDATVDSQWAHPVPRPDPMPPGYRLIPTVLTPRADLLGPAVHRAVGRVLDGMPKGNTMNSAPQRAWTARVAAL